MAEYLRPNRVALQNLLEKTAETSKQDTLAETTNASDNQTHASGPALDGHHIETTNLTHRAVTPPPDDNALRDETIPISSDVLPASSPDVSRGSLNSLFQSWSGRLLPDNI